MKQQRTTENYLKVIYLLSKTGEVHGTDIGSFYSENGDFFFSLKSSISVILIIQSIFDYYKPIFSSLIEK